MCSLSHTGQYAFVKHFAAHSYLDPGQKTGLQLDKGMTASLDDELTALS
jgi:hypothetical protein